MSSRINDGSQNHVAAIARPRQLAALLHVRTRITMTQKRCLSEAAVSGAQHSAYPTQLLTAHNELDEPEPDAAGLRWGKRTLFLRHSKFILRSNCARSELMTLEVFIGYDPRDDRAFRVCESSLKRFASKRIRVRAICEWTVRNKFRYARSYRVMASGQKVDAQDNTPFSTQFSFTRFLVPALAEYSNRLVVYMDPDMLIRADIFELIDACRNDPGKAVYCVQHQHRPRERSKMDGASQTRYPRKNWSSLVVWNPSLNRKITPAKVSRLPGAYLHGFRWLKDEEIGALPEEWNWLEGWSSPRLTPKMVHYTRGTPDMPGYGGVAYAREWMRQWRAVERQALSSSVLATTNFDE